MNWKDLNWKDLIDHCENLLRGGKIPTIQAVLTKIDHENVPANFRWKLANLCRRGGMTTLGLRILTPRHQRSFDQWTKDRPLLDSVEYSALLLRMGSGQEAHSILQNIDEKKAPLAVLYKALYHISRWEHNQAIPLLLRYTDLTDDDYQKTLGLLNLAGAYTGASLNQEAFEVLAQLIPNLIEKKYNRLAANAYELQSQIHIDKKKWDKAEECLKLSSGLLASTRTIDSLFIEKQKAIIAARKSKNTAPLEKLQESLLNRGEWELVRDLDMQKIVVRFDAELHRRLFFGSPHQGFRDRLQRIAAPPVEATYTWGDKNAQIFDIARGLIQGTSAKKTKLPSGGQTHRVIQALAQDFYAPQRVGSLFALIFTSEKFNIFSSPNRVYQAVSRTKSYFEKIVDRSPLERKAQSYFLRPTRELSFLISQEKSLQTWELIQLEKIRELLGNSSSYSPDEIKEKTGLSAAEFKRLRSYAVDKKMVSSIGGGKYVRYQFKKKAS